MGRMMQLEDLITYAASGDGEAACELGLAYSSGCDDLAVDRVQAHRWLNVAVLAGNRAALAWRAEIAAEMSAREVVEAQRLARATMVATMRQAA